MSSQRVNLPFVASPDQFNRDRWHMSQISSGQFGPLVARDVSGLRGFGGSGPAFVSGYPPDSAVGMDAAPAAAGVERITTSTDAAAYGSSRPARVLSGQRRLFPVQSRGRMIATYQEVTVDNDPVGMVDILFRPERQFLTLLIIGGDYETEGYAWTDWINELGERLSVSAASDWWREFQTRLHLRGVPQLPPANVLRDNSVVYLPTVAEARSLRRFMMTLFH